jgi:hypothetical protein
VELHHIFGNEEKKEQGPRRRSRMVTHRFAVLPLSCKTSNPGDGGKSDKHAETNDGPIPFFSQHQVKVKSEFLEWRGEELSPPWFILLAFFRQDRHAWSGSSAALGAGLRGKQDRLTNENTGNLPGVPNAGKRPIGRWFPSETVTVSRASRSRNVSTTRSPTLPNK